MQKCKKYANVWELRLALKNQGMKHPTSMLEIMENRGQVTGKKQ